jgi:hypothetical protein
VFGILICTVRLIRRSERSNCEIKFLFFRFFSIVGSRTVQHGSKLKLHLTATQFYSNEKISLKLIENDDTKNKDDLEEAGSEVIDLTIGSQTVTLDVSLIE